VFRTLRKPINSDVVVSVVQQALIAQEIDRSATNDAAPRREET